MSAKTNDRMLVEAFILAEGRRGNSEWHVRIQFKNAGLGEKTPEEIQAHIDQLVREGTIVTKPQSSVIGATQLPGGFLPKMYYAPDEPKGPGVLERTKLAVSRALNFVS